MYNLVSVHLAYVILKKDGNVDNLVGGFVYHMWSLYKNLQRTKDRRNVIIFTWWYNQQLLKRKGKLFAGWFFYFLNIVLCIKLHQATEKLFIFNLLCSHILYPDCSSPTPLLQVSPTHFLAPPDTFLPCFPS